MTFIPASQTASAGREVFINHGGAYWLNPVPADASRLRSLRTVVRSSDLIDPFGRPKRNDVPELYGKSRYTFNAAGTAGEPLAGETGDTVSENKKESTEGTALGDLQSPVEVNAAHCGTENNTYSSGELICEKLPLVTARPERRLLHPGNQAERIPPTGGSEYNGTGRSRGRRQERWATHISGRRQLTRVQLTTSCEPGVTTRKTRRRRME
ncbi:hypothetical protein ERJ75_001178500 [Trypanosoma vivax]|nr:hypothetical protein ERJ75_001178500 [Trypanosoma vivax]